MRLKKWLNNSVQHTIGMRQTAKTQVTDVRFAKLAKDGAKPMMATRRRLHRRFPMNSQHVDLMNIVTAMQYACKKNNTNENGVLKAFRIGGWFAYKPTPNGLVRAIGGQLSKYPLGSSRLSQKLIDQRFDWVDKNGLPKAPDWNELRDIRHRQNLVVASQATSRREIRDATDAIQETYSQMDDFLDYFDGRRGQIPFEDQDGSSEAMEPLSLSWISPQDLCEDANFLSFHPRVRNEIVMQMGLREILEKMSLRTRDNALVNKIKQDTSRTISTMKFDYAKTIAKLGFDKARSKFVPKSGKK